MQIEGKGFRAPEPRRVTLTVEEVRTFRIWAELTAAEKGYNTDNVFLGWLGEGGYAKLIHSSLAVEGLCKAGVKVDGGDGGIDMETFGQKYQIKTHRKGGQCRVYRTIQINGSVRVLPINVDAFLFAEVISVQSFTEVILLGWIDQRDFLKFGTTRNDNYGKYTIIDPKYLEPVDRLIKRLEAFKVLSENKHGSHTLSR